MTDEKKTTTRKSSTKSTASKTSTAATKTGTARKATTAKKAAPAKSTPARSKGKTATTAKKPDAQVVTIDGKEYALDALTDNAKAQITNLRATDRRIEELESELAITRTARGTYASALERELNELDSKTLQ